MIKKISSLIGVFALSFAIVVPISSCQKQLSKNVFAYSSDTYYLQRQNNTDYLIDESVFYMDIQLGDDDYSYHCSINESFSNSDIGLLDELIEDTSLFDYQLSSYSSESAMRNQLVSWFNNPDTEDRRIHMFCNRNIDDSENSYSELLSCNLGLITSIIKYGVYNYVFYVYIDGDEHEFVEEYSLSSNTYTYTLNGLYELVEFNSYVSLSRTSSQTILSISGSIPRDDEIYLSTLSSPPVNNYTITYNTGVSGLSVSSTTTTGVISQSNYPIPFRTGYRFMGWFATPELDEQYCYTGSSNEYWYLGGDPITTINSNVTFYAKWQNVYTITYVDSYTDNLSPKSVYAYGSYTLTTSDLPVLSSVTVNSVPYYFVGWTNSDHSVFYSNSTQIDSNITLYAYYQSNLVPGDDPENFNIWSVVEDFFDLEIFPGFKMYYLLVFSLGAIVFSLVARSLFR